MAAQEHKTPGIKTFKCTYSVLSPGNEELVFDRLQVL